MFMLMELGPQQCFHLFNGCVKSQPAFVVRVDNTSIVDTGADQPFFHYFDGFFGWSKNIVDLFRRPILAILGGPRVRANILVRTTQYKNSEEYDLNDPIIHANPLDTSNTLRKRFEEFGWTYTSTRGKEGRRKSQPA
jgi:hypothetical protein